MIPSEWAFKRPRTQWRGFQSGKSAKGEEVKMLRGSSLVLFLCLCLLEVNAGSRVEWDAWEDDYECGIIPQTRIYEGTPAKPKDLPWMAVIYYKRGRDPHCGASVINRRFLLTAAHCVTGAIIKFSGEP